MLLHHLYLKTALTAIFLVLTLSGHSLADPQYFNNKNSSSANSYPFDSDGGRAVNWLFLPGDFTQPSPLPAGNMITDVYFFLANGGSRTFTDLTIKMAQDDITTLTGGQFYPGPWVTVYYNASVTLTGATDTWLGPITLDTPFSYDPTRSLLLAVEQSGSVGVNIWVGQDNFAGIRRVYSVGGPPFIPDSGGDGRVVNFGVDVESESKLIPTLTQWGMMAAAAVLGLIGILRIRRRRNG